MGHPIGGDKQKSVLYSQATPARTTPGELHRPDSGWSSVTASRLISQPARQLKAPACYTPGTANHASRLPSGQTISAPTIPPSVTIIMRQFGVLTEHEVGYMI